MIDMGRLILIQLINNQNLPNDEELIIIKKSIQNYKYPVGFLYDTLNFLRTKNNNEASIDSYNYFKALIRCLFSEAYTEEELDIITIYSFMYFYFNAPLNELEINEMKKNLSKTSEKPEIIFLLEDIKFKYLQYLLQHNYNNEENEKLIQNLFNELLAIEDSHNNFYISELKNE